jgi:hypothetical protein
MQTPSAVLYWHLWPVWLYHNFPHYLINGKIVGKMDTEHKMCVLIFSKTFAWKIIILSRIQRDITINVHTSSCKVQLFLSDLNNTFIFSKDCRKIFKYKISCKPSSGSRDVQCGRTERQDEANRCYSQFLEGACIYEQI